MKLVENAKDMKTLPARMTHLQLQNDELQSDLAEYFEINDAIGSAYQPDRETDLSLAKVGVFRTFTHKQTSEAMYQNQLPKCFVEVQLSNMYHANSSDLQRNMLRTIKSKRKMHYSGSRRQKQKRLDVTYFNSNFFFNEHSLKRLYQRSTLRGLTPDDFFVFESEYIEEIGEQIGSYELNGETLTLDVRQDIIFPFKNAGAFFCSFVMTPSEPEEQYSFVPQTMQMIEAPDVTKRMPVLKAHTFFSNEMLDEQQRQVCDLFYQGKYKSAARAMSKIIPRESRLDRHTSVRSKDTKRLVSSIEIISGEKT